ncbi:neutral zinc metallopeptidase [Sphaerisporangium corydalis]|uniref:Neutral zinc metallopeptidase n=1 Tax=Sphaerisporangium corydalis TaxID=1441875 RepID=A0ABV9EBM3_9ACTN|nr:neutral zinc metallopeptidase [Sphaerisporangium corydalis]
MITRKPSIALAAGLLASMLLPGTAQAASPAAAPASASASPVRATALTRSPLYTSGRLPVTRCTEPSVTPGSVASARRYVVPLFNCLSRSWATQLKKARIPFSKPSLQFISKPQRVCGAKWPGHAQGLYCPNYRRIVVLLDKNITQQAEELFLMDVIAHEYGHHVQNVSGIERAFSRLPSRNKSEYNEQLRRLELQAECLSGAFIGSVWDSLDRPTDDWEFLLDATRESGDEHSKVRDHGKGRTIANWLRRGFQAAGPAGCNTWIGSSAMVASTPAN